MESSRWWRRFLPLRFYRSAAVNSPHASGAWYFEWRGRGWHIEVIPVGPHLWQPDFSQVDGAWKAKGG